MSFHTARVKHGPQPMFATRPLHIVSRHSPRHWCKSELGNKLTVSSRGPTLWKFRPRCATCSWQLDGDLLATSGSTTGCLSITLRMMYCGRWEVFMLVRLGVGLSAPAPI